MYRLLIADDEEAIRKGLKRFLDWEAMGFRVEGLFQDGADVIRYLSSHPADVVLADMRMCEVSGLELGAHIREKYPRIKVIIFSGHSDYCYLRESIRLGLNDYLLKPVRKENLTQVFERVREELDKENGLRSDVQKLAENCRALAQATSGGQEIDAMLAEWLAGLRRLPASDRMGVIEYMFFELHHALEERGVSLPARLSPRLILLKLQNVPEDALPDVIAELVKEMTSARQIHPGKEDVVKLVRGYVDTHLSDEFTVNEIARSTFFSVSHISREYRRLAGENITDYILRRRMALAMRLLSEGERPIAQICAQTGYRDARYFQKIFKKYTGQTPREWRTRPIRQEAAQNDEHES